jgi:hypothetical protein
MNLGLYGLGQCRWRQVMLTTKKRVSDQDAVFDLKITLSINTIGLKANKYGSK